LLTVICIRQTLDQRSLLRVTRQEDGTPWEFVPFQSRLARFAAAVAGDRVLVADETGVVALFDPATKNCLRQTSLGHRCKKVKGLLRHDGQQAVLYTESALFLLDCDTLAVLAAFNGLRPRPSGEGFDLVADLPGDGVQAIQIDSAPGLVGHPDGRLLASSTIPQSRPAEKPAGPVSYGLIVFDLERKTATREVAQTESSTVFQNSFRWFSPSGRLAIRLHCAAIPRHDGRSSWRYADIFSRMLGKSARPELPDCKLDHMERVGTAVEIWETSPLKPVAKLVVHMEPLDAISVKPDDREDIQDLARKTDFASKKPGDSFPFELDQPMRRAAEHWLHLQRHLIDLAWEADESGFWILLERGILRRVALDGTVSPLFALRHLRRLAKNAGEKYRGDARDRQHILHVLADGRIRINHLGDRIVRVPLSGTALGGEEISIEEEESHTPGLPLDLPMAEAASRFFGRNVRTFIELSDLTQDSIIGAIDSLTERIAANLPDLVLGPFVRYLHVLFVTPSHMIDEPQFFDLASKLDAAVIIPALRRLLLAFCKARQAGVLRTGIVYDDFRSALPHALLVLIELDAHCIDVVTAYMSSRNVANSPFIRNEVLLAFHDRFGWKGDAGIRLAVLFAHYEAFHGGAGIRYLWEEYRLREVARELSPEAFADLILAERAPLGSKTDLREVVEAWVEILTDDPFEAAVKALLMAKGDPEGPEAITHLQEAIAQIAAKYDSADVILLMFRSQALDRIGRAKLSARDFGALIVEATQSRADGGGKDGRRAARIVQVLRAIAEAFDRDDPYGAEVLDFLNEACNAAVARVQAEMKAGSCTAG